MQFQRIKEIGYLSLNDLKSLYSNTDFHFDYSLLLEIYDFIKNEIEYLIISDGDVMFFDNMGRLYTSGEIFFISSQLNGH